MQFFSKLNPIKSKVEFVENYFLVVLKMKTTKNSLLQILIQFKNTQIHDSGFDTQCSIKYEYG